MQCNTCNKELDIKYFLPYPQREELHIDCVFCMHKRFSVVSKFCKVVADEGVEFAFSSLSQQEKSFVNDVTCLQKELLSINELKKIFRENYIRPEGETRDKNLLRFRLKCACDSTCSYDGMAIERQDGSFLWQTFNNHSCSERNLEQDWLEIEKFESLVGLIEKVMPSDSIVKANEWSTDYKTLSKVYNKGQQEVHDLEDQAIKEVWGLPCVWRRARGEVNELPSQEDVVTLKEIVKKRELLSSELDDYIDNNFYVPQPSYFQQRGYFILLMCSSLSILQDIFEARLRVMYYARNLLQQDMFLLCFRRLNRIVLRNHVWMLGFLWQVMMARKSSEPLPLMGKTTIPLDSESKSLYEDLNDFFHRQGDK
ncbi:hypothetical protein [Candidatus Uabimicrobium sp. HlEnr_7]|uniref:hypothetical protein n=1 Tax=Candidatus Uabimicrobium helgolandensis TaxID=3095367 RepID=UPI003555FEAD